MATTVTLNGVSYTIPAVNDEGWGTNVSNYLIAIAQSTLQKSPASGGSFTLTAEVNFGATYGFKTAYLKSQATDPASAGIIRLGNAESVAWKKIAAGDALLSVSAADRLQFDSVNIPTISSTDTLTNKTLTSPAITSPTGLVKADVGLSNVDNTSDASKPISTLTQTALDLKAPIASPTFTGTVAGITSTMVGLGNVDNTSNATERAATAVLTNKDIDGGTASNTSRITIPKASSATLAALTRKQGTVMYDTSLLKLLVDNGTTLDPVGSGSGLGTGEVNAITNPVASNDASGWTGVTRVTSGSPLDPVTTTAFSIANTAGAESSTSGGYASITTLAAPLRSMKLKVEFWYTTPATDVYAVSVYAGATRLSLSSDSSSVTTLPANTTGKFTASFDSTTATAYSLNVTRTSGSTGACIITNVVVGPGTITQGAAVSDWQSYTPTFSAGFGTVSTQSFQYRRVGSSMEIIGQFVTGTVAASAPGFTLPSGTTVNTSAVTAVQSVLGNYYTLEGSNSINSSASKSAALVYGTGLGSSYLSLASLGDGASPPVFAITNTSTIFNAGWRITIRASVPIAEWAGSGTVNLGAGSVEYASVGGTWDADSTTTVYGPGGSLMGGALTTARDKTITWQYPPQSDDIIILEFKPAAADAGWISLPDFFPNDNSNAGAYIVTTDSTGKTLVRFRRYRTGTNDWLNTYTWRVRKAKAGAAVGFGMAGTDGSSGLVAAGRVPGLVTGAAVSAGFVGERLVQSQTGVTGINTGSYTTVLTALTLTAGVWDISCMLRCLSTASMTQVDFGIATATNSSTGHVVGDTATTFNMVTGSDNGGCIPAVRVSISATTPYFLTARPFGSSSGNYSARLSAVRIA